MGRAQVSIMYIPLWVDEASAEKGTLHFKGREVTNRARGRTYYSKDVVYTKNNCPNENTVYDYVSEFVALKAGLQSGWIDIESHGLTHLDTKIEDWLEAEDRYSNWCWWHEFRHVIDNRDCTVKEQQYVLQDSAKLIERFFSISPSAVTPSGHEQSKNSEQLAHGVEYKLFSSEYNSFQQNDLILRNDKITSIFLDSTPPNSSYVNAGYPVVGVFHDYEIAHKGIDWFEGIIRDWKKKGIQQFITLRELAGCLCSSFEACFEDKELRISVDISKTSGVSNKPESRYHCKHKMIIDITIPKGETLHSVMVDGVPWDQFELNPSRQLKITLPPFQNRDRQNISILLV